MERRIAFSLVWISPCCLLQFRIKQPFAPLPPSHLVPLTIPCTLMICEDEVCQLIQRQKIRKARRLDVSNTPARKLILTSQHLTWAVWSSLLLQTLHNLPDPQEIGLLQAVFLTSVVMKYLKEMVLAHPEDITAPLLVSLQFVFWSNRLANCAVNMGLNAVTDMETFPPHSSTWSECLLQSSERTSRGCKWSSTRFRSRWSSSTSQISLFIHHFLVWIGLPKRKDHTTDRTVRTAEKITGAILQQCST